QVIEEELLDEAPRARAQIAAEVQALRQVDAFDHPDRRGIFARKQPLLQAREIDLDRGADRSGALPSGTVGLVHELLGVQVQLQAGLGRSASTAAHTQVAIEDYLKILHANLSRSAVPNQRTNPLGSRRTASES